MEANFHRSRKELEVVLFSLSEELKAMVSDSETPGVRRN